MRATYKFTAYNSQALYGYGTEAEAEAYANYLNRDREINVYGYEAMADEDVGPEADDGFQLDDALREIADAE